MARKDWYTVREFPDKFVVTKFADSVIDNDITPYEVSKHGATVSDCTCPAGHKWCRHKQMIGRFQQQGRINTGWLHNFDKNAWKEPPKGLSHD